MERAFLCTFLTAIFLPQGVYLGYFYPTVFWLPDNCRFSLNKPEYKHLAPHGYFLKVRANSHMIFLCPTVATFRDTSSFRPSIGHMKENLLLVDKETYESCSVGSIPGKHFSQEILRCDKSPYELKYTQEIFSQINAHKSMMTYLPGKDYYFISTADGSLKSLNNTSGGHCKTHNMKLRVYVCRDDELCEFEMPRCPYKTKMFKYDRIRPTDSGNGTAGSTPEPPVSAQSGSSELLSKSVHLILHIGAAAMIVILAVTLICVVCHNRRNRNGRKRLNGETVDSEKPIIRRHNDQVSL